VLGILVRTRLIPASNGSKIPKGKGKCSMSGKGGRERSYLAPHRQRKVCKVKAELLEPQAPRSQSGRPRRVAETGYRNDMADRPAARKQTPAYNSRAEVPSLSGVPAVSGIKGTNGEPTHTAAHHSRNAGSPKLAWHIKRPPVWRRSLHNTLGWPVMGSADGTVLSYRQRYKLNGNVSESRTVEGKGGSPYQPTTTLNARVC
jgi:hypothetical protein